MASLHVAASAEPVRPIEPPRPGGSLPSTLAFGMVKGGSTLLFNLLRDASDHVASTYYAVEDVLFAQGAVARDRPLALDLDFAPVGYCYGGWRAFPHYRIPLVEQARTIWLIRDPRDMLVSLYYSTAFSHAPPGGQAGERFLAARARVRKMDVDGFARARYQQHLRVVEGYYAMGFPTRPNVRAYRYEDVIFDKEAWLADIARWFGWDLDSTTIASIVAPYDLVPEVEDPGSHIRRVTPGSHLEQLSDATRRSIDNIFHEYLRDYYPEALD